MAKLIAAIVAMFLDRWTVISGTIRLRGNWRLGITLYYDRDGARDPSPSTPRSP